MKQSAAFSPKRLLVEHPDLEDFYQEDMLIQSYAYRRVVGLIKLRHKNTNQTADLHFDMVHSGHCSRLSDWVQGEFQVIFSKDILGHSLKLGGTFYGNKSGCKFEVSRRNWYDDKSYIIPDEKHNRQMLQLSKSIASKLPNRFKCFENRASSRSHALSDDLSIKH